MDFYVTFLCGIFIPLKGSSLVTTEVTLTKSLDYVPANSSVTLTCAFDDVKMVGIQWSLKRMRSYFIAADCAETSKVNSSLYSYLCAENRFSWTIKNVTKSNEGDIWLCIIFSTDVPITSNEVQIHVEVPIQNVSITKPDESIVDVYESTQKQFMCMTSEGQPPPVVRWYKDRGTLFNDTDDVDITSFSTSRTMINGLTTVTSTLNYSSSRSDNGMEIFCTANNTATILASERKRLNVEYGASVSAFVIEGNREGNPVIVDEHADVKFICEVDSNPSSNMKIISEGTILAEQNGTHHLSYSRKDVTCLDGNVYTCLGTNDYGFPSIENVTLLVRCSPRPTHSINNITSPLNVPVTLTFNVLAYPGPGSSGFSWHKKDGDKWALLRSSTEFRISSLGMQSNLMIFNVSKEDFGQYRLTVVNNIGKYEQNFILTEKDFPTQSRILQKIGTTINVTLIVGGTLGLVIVVLAAYGTYVTILLKRKTARKGTRLTEKSTSKITYVNLQLNPRTSEDQLHTRSNDGIDDFIGTEEEYSRKYTRLDPNLKGNDTAYDTIQRI